LSILLFASMACAPIAWASGDAFQPLFDRSEIEADFAAWYANRDGWTPLIKETAYAFVDGCGRKGLKPATCERGSAEDKLTRRRAAATIVAMLDMLLPDEQRGTWGAVATPSSAGGFAKSDPAQHLRWLIFNSVSGARDDDYLPMLAWVLANEDEKRSRRNALIVLRSIKSEAADELVVSLVEHGGADDDEFVAALTELNERSPDRAAELALPYAQDPRKKRRSAAREVLGTRGEALPAFDGGLAIEAYRDRFTQALELLPESIRVSRFVSVRLALRGAGHSVGLRGFELRSADPSRIRLLTSSLDFVAASRDDIEGGVVEIPLAEETARVIAQRAGVLAGEESADVFSQFEEDSISAYEVLLAAVLFERGDAASAARVLLPPLDASKDGADFLKVYRRKLAFSLYHDAIERFVGDRDYEAAAATAGFLAQRFPAFGDRDTVKRLAEQLPERLDEFRTFTLPTTAQWETDSRDMSRKQKIDWLCDHLRLVNAFQDGQPGGVAFGGPQFAEPSGMVDAAWSLGRGRTPVLNPVGALREMALTPADVALLAPHLDDDRLLPSVGFHRDFAPGRTLYSTADLVGFQINAIAKQQLVPRDGVDELEPQVRQELIASIVAWSSGNETRSDENRLLDILRKDQKWFAIGQHVVREVVALKLTAAAPLVLAYLDRTDVSTHETQQILRTAAALDGPLAVDAASARLHDGNPSVKIEAGLVVAKWGDAEAGRRALREGLQEGNRSTMAVVSAGAAVAALLSTGRAEDETAAMVIFEKDYFTEAWPFDKKTIAAAFGDRGGLVLRFYRRSLDTPGTTQFSYNGNSVEEPKGFRFAREVVDHYGSPRVGMKWPLPGDSRQEKDAAFEKVRAWLDAEIARIDAAPGT
jgi:hypothetical protein